MSLFRLALKDISRNELRSGIVFLSALAVAGLVSAAGLLTVGTTAGLRLTEARLGADLLVVPRGQAPEVENALLMGEPVSAWMSADVVDKVGMVRGVSAASPQTYLTSLAGASCCSVGNMFVVAFDPATDFTVQPWLEEKLSRPLAVGEAVGGAHVSVAQGETGIRIYGHTLDLAANLEPTGSNLDESLFLTIDTARAVARTSLTDAEKPLVIPEGRVSSVLVKTDAGVDPQSVAAAIAHQIPETSVVLSPRMFDRFRGEISVLLQALMFASALVAGLALLLVGLVFLMAAHQRRREIGVWRALGATRGNVVASFALEAVTLALAGGVTGIAVALWAVFLFRDHLVASLGVPLMIPSVGVLALLALGGLAIAVGVATAASVIPALNVCRQDPAQAMRE